ncbi:MAG: VOC family protein [Caulobacteraceae bacterium]|nr:VOC family protein [Caulobacteraceae bacterium]
MPRPYGSFWWYELMTTDLPAAQRFYDAVIGWKSQKVDQPGGAYSLFMNGDTPAAGALPLLERGHQGPAGNLWIGYIDVPDVDAFTGKVTAAGGTIHRQPEDIPGIGRFAVTADPHGALFVLFTPAPGSPPAAPEGQPGLIGWRELMAGDLETEWKFYTDLFGWTVVQEIPMGPMGVYRLFSTGGAGPAGGMMTKPLQTEQPHWRYVFQVESVTAAAPKITAAGGAVLSAPQQVPNGQWVLQASDPQGGFFSLVSSSP